MRGVRHVCECVVLGRQERQVRTIHQRQVGKGATASIWPAPEVTSYGRHRRGARVVHAGAARERTRLARWYKTPELPEGATNGAQRSLRAKRLGRVLAAAHDSLRIFVDQEPCERAALSVRRPYASDIAGKFGRRTAEHRLEIHQPMRQSLQRRIEQGGRWASHAVVSE